MKDLGDKLNNAHQGAQAAQQAADVAQAKFIISNIVRVFILQFNTIDTRK